MASLQHDFAEIHTADRDLAELTTWRIGGPVADFFAPRDAGECSRLLLALAAAGRSWRVLGGGANVLVDDRPSRLPVIHTGQLLRLDFEDEGRLVVGAGQSFPRLVSDCARRGLGGLEVLAGIPGLMGGICAMNAGGRWGEIRERVEWIEFVDAAGAIRRLDPEAIGFGYRSTRLPSGIITAVALRLDPGANSRELVARQAEVLRAKSAAQPLKVPSGGCVFANPEGRSAGLLVEEAGLKGRRIGDAQISEKHGNFIVNLGAARSSDVLRLMELIETTILARHGLVLRREVKVWPASS